MSMKRSEKGLLTPDNCVVALIDHQPQMLFGVSNFDRQSIINNTVALAKAARVFSLPVVLSTVESKSFSGNLWPQIKAVFPNQVPIERTSMDAWDDKNFVAAIEKELCFAIHDRDDIRRTGIQGRCSFSLPPESLQSLAILGDVFR